jgi:adenosyl cobinamide kinase/adenosyl cobinamide phosphate guanylyltransferase
MMILVTGGARSGKSRHAEALIADSPNVLYIATSQILMTRWLRESSTIAMDVRALAHRRTLATS